MIFHKWLAMMPGAVYRCCCDAHWTMVFISDAIATISGYPATDFHFNQVRSFASLIHADDIHSVETTVRQAVSQGTAYNLECRIIHADGSIRWITGKGQGVFDDRDELMWLEGIILDVTEQKLTELRLKQQVEELQATQQHIIQSEKMASLGQMAAGIAHEMNNPVNFVFGSMPHANEYVQDLLRLVQLYQQVYPNPEPEIQAAMDAMDLEFLMVDLPKLLTSMQAEMERIREIVRSLRTVCRKDDITVQSANVHEGIDSTLVILQHRLKAKPNCPEIKVVKEYADLPQIDCYPGQLNQVFMNLFSNAIDVLEEACHRCSGGSNPTLIRHPTEQPCAPIIRVSTELVNADWIRIRIADNGPGMSEAVRSQLFTPFFTTKPAAKGTGLGLSISQRIIIEKHGGNLYCHSTPGQGTEFVIEIPIYQDVSNVATDDG